MSCDMYYDHDANNGKPSWQVRGSKPKSPSAHMKQWQVCRALVADWLVLGGERQDAPVKDSAMLFWALQHGEHVPLPRVAKQFRVYTETLDLMAQLKEPVPALMQAQCALLRALRILVQRDTYGHSRNSGVTKHLAAAKLLLEHATTERAIMVAAAEERRSHKMSEPEDAQDAEVAAT